MLIFAIVISFILSFIFALGGVGSAIALVPVLSSFTPLPLNTIKPIALLSNTLSMTGATVNNLKNRRVDWQAGLPLIISSMIMATLGAYLSQFINKKVLILLFVLFLLFSASMMLFYQKREIDSDRPFDKFYLIVVN